MSRVLWCCAPGASPPRWGGCPRGGRAEKSKKSSSARTRCRIFTKLDMRPLYGAARLLVSRSRGVATSVGVFGRGETSKKSSSAPTRCRSATENDMRPLCGAVRRHLGVGAVAGRGLGLLDGGVRHKIRSLAREPLGKKRHKLIRPTDPSPIERCRSTVLTLTSSPNPN